MPIISAELVHAGGKPAAAELEQQLLSGQTLLSESADHLIEVVDVLKSYGEVLDAYSINLIFQAEQQFLLPFPLFKYLDGDKNPAKIWRHLIHDRINFEYAEYCMKAMLWHGTGGLDAYLDSDAFAANCAAIIRRKTRLDPLLALLNPLFRGFLPELIRTAATTHALGQFWRVMSDLFIDLAKAEADGRVASIDAVVEFIKDGGEPINPRRDVESQGPARHRERHGGRVRGTKALEHGKERSSPDRRELFNRYAHHFAGTFWNNELILNKSSAPIQRIPTSHPIKRVKERRHRLDLINAVFGRLAEPRFIEGRH